MTQIFIDIIGYNDLETRQSLGIRVPPNTNTFLKEGDLNFEGGIVNPKPGICAHSSRESASSLGFGWVKRIS